MRLAETDGKALLRRHGLSRCRARVLLGSDGRPPAMRLRRMPTQWAGARAESPGAGRRPRQSGCLVRRTCGFCGARAGAPSLPAREKVGVRRRFEQRVDQLGIDPGDEMRICAYAIRNSGQSSLHTKSRSRPKNAVSCCAFEAVTGDDSAPPATDQLRESENIARRRGSSCNSAPAPDSPGERPRFGRCPKAYVQPVRRRHSRRGPPGRYWRAP